MKAIESLGSLRVVVQVKPMQLVTSLQNPDSPWAKNAPPLCRLDGDGRRAGLWYST